MENFERKNDFQRALYAHHVRRISYAFIHDIHGSACVIDGFESTVISYWTDHANDSHESVYAIYSQ